MDLVIPVFNSKNILDELINRLIQFYTETSVLLHVYFVDDGSGDGSFEHLKTIQCPFDFTAIQLGRNYGQHTATAIGLSYCRSEFCVTMDDDLQHNPLDINTLMNEMNSTGADLVYGKFIQKKHNLIRNLGSWLLKKAVYKDNVEYIKVSSFRLLNVSIARQFSAQSTPISFIDDMLLSSAGKVTSVLVNHQSANEVRSRYSSMELIRFAFRILLFHSSFPLRFIIRIAIYCTTVFFVIGCYFMYNHFINNVPFGYSAIIVSVFFSSGIILISLGIIANYVRKIGHFKQGVEKVLINGIFQHKSA